MANYTLFNSAICMSLALISTLLFYRSPWFHAIPVKILSLAALLNHGSTSRAFQLFDRCYVPCFIAYNAYHAIVIFKHHHELAILFSIIGIGSATVLYSMFIEQNNNLHMVSHLSAVISNMYVCMKYRKYLP